MHPYSKNLFIAFKLPFIFRFGLSGTLGLTREIELILITALVYTANESALIVHCVDSIIVYTPALSPQLFLPKEILGMLLIH